MKSSSNILTVKSPFPLNRPAKLIVACALSVLLAGCKHGEEGTQVAGWALIDSSQRHPILVSQQPANLNIRVPSGSHGLSPQQRAQLLEFAERYRTGDGGNSRLVISAPSGSPNEMAAMGAVGEIRGLLANRGYSEASITVEAYTEEHDANAPIRVSYLRYVAEGPQCGQFPANLARQPDNLPYANFGCATQHNFAAMVANPADLVAPRNMTPRSADRRATTWGKYVKGETTGAQKSDDEKASVKSSN
jgi:pilus assembly protein CpaD